ncbi:hypothetical protein TI03_07515, partial [Achromatium sp. WMS1]
IDALFIPKGHDGPTYLIEFQAQWSITARYNLLTKIGLYGEEHPQQQIQGILIFADHKYEAVDTRNKSPDVFENLIQVIYLDDFLPNLLNQEPNNPFVAIFAPLILNNEIELEQQAPKLWQTVHNANIDTTIRNNLQQILECWFLERFTCKTPREILTMLQNLTPLEETLAYKT